MRRHERVLQFAQRVVDRALVAAHHLAAERVVHRVFANIHGVFSDEAGDRLTGGQVVVVEADEHRLFIRAERREAGGRRVQVASRELGGIGERQQGAIG